MKALKQLLRQPLKTSIGIILMTLAAVIVCLCVGQALAAQTTKEMLNHQFSTVGIPLVQEDLDGNVTQSSFLLEEEFLTWLEKMAAEHPDIVKQLARHGIMSAYIPELTPLNFTTEKHFYMGHDWYSYQSSPGLMPYTCAMLVITLDEVSEPMPITGTYSVEGVTRDDFASQSDYYAWLFDHPDAETMTATQGYSIKLTGTVTDVVSLADGYRDPVGRIARLTFTAPTLEEVGALDLVPGEQYIVYGMDYTDQHWLLMSRINPDGLLDYLDMEHYDPELVRLLTEEEKQEHSFWAEAFPEEMGYRKYLYACYSTYMLTEPEYLQLNAISMTLDSPVAFIRYEEIRDELTGELLELRPETQVTCTDAGGKTVTYSHEEYIRRYQIPTIARLDGTVEDFLNSEDGAPWKTALEQSAVNNQAFNIIGVDKMDYLADFSLQRSRISEGRDFTAEELESGSRVCIIHDSLAKENGIHLGDTITANLYSADYGLPYQQLGKRTLNPSTPFYFSTTPFEETAEYTVVGIWHGEKVWPDVAYVSEYAFSPNTIFVPKSSVQASMEECDSIVFNTLMIQNAKIEEFHELAMNSGYAGRFKYNDQNYSTIAANFHNYDSLARQMLIVGTVLYAVLLLLFLLLYPGAQKRTVLSMQSFGAGFFRRFGHVMVSSLGIVIPSSLLGGWIGGQLWGRLVTALQSSAESTVALQIEPGTLWAVALLQLIFAVVLTIFVALAVAAPRGMSARR